MAPGRSEEEASREEPCVDSYLAVGATGVAGTPAGAAGMLAGGAGIVWTGGAAPFMMLRVPLVPEK